MRLCDVWWEWRAFRRWLRLRDRVAWADMAAVEAEEVVIDAAWRLGEAGVISEERTL